MQGSQILFLVVVFVVVTAVALVAMAVFGSGGLRQRLQGFLGKREETQAPSNGWVERVVKAARPFSQLSVPEEGWERSALRTRFMNAGWRDPASTTLYFAAKTLLALGLPALVVVSAVSLPRHVPANAFLLLLFFLATTGYYLPNLVLAQRVRRRQAEIFECIPDALDLLTVCVEAGLSLERAMMKVASEIDIKSRVLAEELQLVLMEMRAGFSKEKALRNFALRTGVEDIDTLVAMLVQSERFGTSMGESLRVHSDNLRTKRRMLAEEAAAKIALKLMFPLIFFIFPTLLMVLMAPAFLALARTLMPALNGN
ncbi:type II secretion system F family protein [Massilia sp. TS11]|uniref:type II secretion system F family protein n=1 Tax=Massilia sp. TS11 TaxID=2908003 RepID=UPI001EDB1EFC|nr:type II secretion system F family protein [Massilia sp. TS11]MCG2585816.1 type II secretion system F family protein [Massilia sp. TS11]